MNQFEFTIATKEEISSKLDVFKELQSLFNENLKISDYSEIYKSIFMIYQCFPENSPYFSAKESIKIRRKTNVIEIYSLLDYDEIMLADEKKIMSMMSETYLNSIQLHLKMKGFNQEKFYVNIQILLKPYLP